MIAPDTATIPDLSFLKDLPPGVAYLALVTVIVVTLLFYVGPVIRARLLPRPPEPPAATPASPEVTMPAIPQSLPVVMDRADVMQQRFIDHLLRQIEGDAAENETLERRVEELQLEVQRLNRMLWQRGAS